MKKKVIIIGGGIAGLSAGIYSAKCGFEVTVLESHNLAGGNCTSWKRNGYLFEGGMHWLTGSNKNEDLHKMWRYVGALDDSVPIYTPEPFLEYDHQGTPIRLYRDVDTTQKYLTELAGADEKEIKGLCNNIRKVQKLAMPVTDIQGVKVTKKNRLSLSLLFSVIPAFLILRKFRKISQEAYISRFSHEGIRDLLRSCTDSKTGVVPLFFTMGILARGDGGFPAGGSLPFVERIVKTFISLGGELCLSTRAEQVVIENNQAVGVMVNGNMLAADAVIITSDTMSMDSLFVTPPNAPWLAEMRATTEPTMATFISLGLNADLSKYQKGFIFKLNQPIILGSQTYEYLNANNYASDPTYSPPGKTALTIILSGDTYDFWKKAKNEGRYAEEKEKISAEVIKALAEYLPETKDTVEVTDIATPLTYERYCGNWKGSWMTEMTPSMKMQTYPAVIQGLGGLYFAGQRMLPPGGLPGALMSGRTAVQYLCRDTNTVFISEG
ncbi:MAG: NAD(P)/FAD-dependent oxidoreductase [Clostridiales bacterium]|nr:NAD(P)/FAD-dependent oxidoreductase [Clostridiales bacterium]